MLSNTDKYLLIDVLWEFVHTRTENDISLVADAPNLANIAAGAQKYVAKRYAEQPKGFRIDKANDVALRVQRALQMIEMIHNDTFPAIGDNNA